MAVMGTIQTVQQTNALSFIPKAAALPQNPQRRISKAPEPTVLGFTSSASPAWAVISRISPWLCTPSKHPFAARSTNRPALMILFTEQPFQKVWLCRTRPTAGHFQTPLKPLPFHHNMAATERFAYAPALSPVANPMAFTLSCITWWLRVSPSADILGLNVHNGQNSTPYVRNLFPSIRAGFWLDVPPITHRI